MHQNKISQNIQEQLPAFIQQDNPLFVAFLEHYYRSQEKTGFGVDIINNLLNYLDIDSTEIRLVDSGSFLLEDVSPTDTNIVVEDVNGFIDEGGTILIDDEIIFYERTTKAPNIAITDGISFPEVRNKWVELGNPFSQFDSTKLAFDLNSANIPVSPLSANHLLVRVFGEYLIPDADYLVVGSQIQFTQAPRRALISDSIEQTSIEYFKGYAQNTVVTISSIQGLFNGSRKKFPLLYQNTSYNPILPEYTLVVKNGQTLIPNIDYSIFKDQIIFKVAPQQAEPCHIRSIEAPIPSGGTGASAVAKISETGSIQSILVKNGGKNYTSENRPRVQISSEVGRDATAISQVNGILSMKLLRGGYGYSDTNPPIVTIEAPTQESNGTQARIKAVVENGSVTSLELLSSGSNYTFTPRVTFKDPGGATISGCTVSNGQINANSITVLEGGEGYTTAPLVYVDPPTGANPVQAVITTTITNGKVTAVTVSNPGRGYVTAPRIAVIDPSVAQVLDVEVDNLGRVISIELLSGGSGFNDIPSVYIVDDRKDEVGNYIGGSGAKATATIFNGAITDINIVNFGTGYSSQNPPKVYIQRPLHAQASVEIGFGQVTGFEIIESGTEYQKSQFVGCARGVAGPTGFDGDGNLVFKSASTAATHSIVNSARANCLDGLFVKKVLSKFISQFLPDLPNIDIKTVDPLTVIKTIREFYSTKGSSQAISYIFKILFGEKIDVLYPRDQVIKPSAATWSIDTIVRAVVVSGNPVNLKDSLLVQTADAVDTNIGNASALVENFISIQTSTGVPIYELVLSEETIEGLFTIPYKTKLAERVSTTDSIITVDSTIGWPERNGEIVIGNELIQYKEKTLNQFIECTRSKNGVIQDWDSGTEVTSNFSVYANKGTDQEVEIRIVGIVEASKTQLVDTGSYYIAGDKLTVSKLGSTDDISQLKSWIYNVKKLIAVTSIESVDENNPENNQNVIATVTTATPHGLFVGDKVIIYGANPIVYNGEFLVSDINKNNPNEFQYQLPFPAPVNPQGNILISVELNKGKSNVPSIYNQIKYYTTNVQNSFFDDNYVYVASTGLPNYDVGPFGQSALLPGNQRKLNRFPKLPQTISTKSVISPGPVGTFVNGVSVWSYKSPDKKIYGPVTSIDVVNSGDNYDADNPPILTIAPETGRTGSGARGTVIVNGGVKDIEVISGGSGYTSAPLVSIVGGGGQGAAATAIISKGEVTRILVTSSGTGYTSRPSISLSGGGGTGATAEAVVRGPINKIELISGGTGYDASPSVTLSSGTGALAEAFILNGRIVSIQVINAGQGYTTAPTVKIYGSGFGAIAKATINTDGENAGRIQEITIENRGIGYTQGTTTIVLESVGSGAELKANVFEWTYNLKDTSDFDDANGGVFSGLNNQYGGEYAHLSNPQRLRYVLGDAVVFSTTSNRLVESTVNVEHSPIIGWAFDGNPIYGPYSYSDPTDQGSQIKRVTSSYNLKEELVYNSVTNPFPSRIDGPSVDQFPAGYFIEDYEYLFGLGDLDQYNGRFTKTPEYPDGTYAYFVTIDASENGVPVFPYIIGGEYNSIVDKWNLSSSATQNNIPKGVVRFRDPYENVDIDIERQPNEETSGLITETGEILAFDPEDEDGDGDIDSIEVANVQQIFEESKLEIFDYFPKVKIDSKVDIEVETTTKFEDAQVTGFVIENPGNNYQVNDRLTFDNTGTDGEGASALISKILGKEIISYNFQTVDNEPYGIVETQDPHEVEIGDTVFIDYTPEMTATDKKFKVRVVDGIESLEVTQVGTGYTEDIPIQVDLDGDGVDAIIEPVVNKITGTISEFKIVNSGSGYTENPRIIVSHPQVFKKSDYYYSVVSNSTGDDIVINDSIVLDDKTAYVCGCIGGDTAFVAKISATGAKVWEKKSTAPNAEYVKLYIDGNTIYTVGQIRPYGPSLNSYNPDILLSTFTENTAKTNATHGFTRAISGISGNQRADYITVFTKYENNRFVIGGYTNTNSSYPTDAWIALISTTGEFVTKRKISSTEKSEKLLECKVINNKIYALLEVTPTAVSTVKSIAISRITVDQFGLLVDYTKEYGSSAYNIVNAGISYNEYNEIILSAALQTKTNSEVKNILVSKFDSNSNIIWAYRYSYSDYFQVDHISGEVDIFGDYNYALTITKTNGRKYIESVKVDYKGNISKTSIVEFKEYDGDDYAINSKYFGTEAKSIFTDESGDVYVSGRILYDRNEFTLNALANGQQSRYASLEATPNNFTAVTNVGTISSGASLVPFQANSTEIRGNSGSGFDASYIRLDYDTNNGFDDALEGDFTLEGFFATTSVLSALNTTNVNNILFQIGDANNAAGGLALVYNETTRRIIIYLANGVELRTVASAATSVAAPFSNNTINHVALRRSGNIFTVYVNGVLILTSPSVNVPLATRDVFIGNGPGWNGTTGQFRVDEQGSFLVDYIKLRNRAVSVTSPSDLGVTQRSIGYAWTDTTWFETYLGKVDYINQNAFIVKADKASDAIRLGNFPLTGNIAFTGLGITRSIDSTSRTKVATALSAGTWTMGAAGLQVFDVNNLTQVYGIDNIAENSWVNDIFSSRTATVPAPGSKKVKVTAKSRGKFYIKVSDTLKIDNVQKLTINQPFNFTKNTKLLLNNGSTFVNSGYIVDIDADSVYVAVNNNSWANDTNIGSLSTEQFSVEDYDIVGPIPSDVNEIKGIVLENIINVTPGTFQVDLSDYTYLLSTLDQYASFKNHSDLDYSVRITEVSGPSIYVQGSVVSIPNPTQNFSFVGTTKKVIEIEGLSGVTKIDLICNLTKVLKVTAVSNTDTAYVITGSRHYLSAGDMIFVDGNPTRTVSNVDYDEYDGAFTVDTVVGTKEFTYKLGASAVGLPADTASSVDIYSKTPVLKMYYGHKYEFDVSHPSLNGYFFSFSRDNLYKLEYSFNSIIRTGIPGVVAVNSTVTPKIQFVVTKPEITGISYYFDPSRTDDETSPVSKTSYIDVVDSPYTGEFTVTGIAGATITRGADIFKFKLSNEPEGSATITRDTSNEVLSPTYTTSSLKVAGPIGGIRLVSGGGFYKKLPIVSGIESSRKIERINIIEPGTEYAVGTYERIPILGDGSGGLARVTVANTTDAEGNPIPGQIVSAVVTTAGKGYTTAFIDVPSIPGIFGSTTNPSGSGGELEVEIPPFGTGASIFTTGSNVGKIKKLKNNNFGYDYPHDYTLRPEITFPINAQLINTSVLTSIRVVDPGSGYTQPPTVIIEGGGGLGATAESTIRNGRIDNIIIKDPGSGYSSTPAVSLKSEFYYIINLDLGLLQFSYPHGILNGSRITLQVEDDGDIQGTFPIAGGSIGSLNSSTTYYAIAGTAQSLEDNQLKLAITPQNAELGDAVEFVNAGTGRQILLTDAFGGSAVAVLGTGNFLSGEKIYQGDVNNPTATGYISDNDGWLIGPRLVKIVNYTGTFLVGEKLYGSVSKSSGIISNLSIARGTLEIDSLTKTTGQFIDDVGKPSEIIQKIHDSYYYQDFSYAVQSSTSINFWKELILSNAHPAGFKVFGELDLSEESRIENKTTDFELIKSVNLAENAIVPNIQNFSLVEPIYTQFNNTEVLFRQRRLTSSENILTSIVQRLDDISYLFDGERISFPLSVNQEQVSANANQLMIVLNGVVQNPETSFEVQGDQIVFSEPPQPAAAIKYANVEIQQLTLKKITFSNISGIFPTLGDTIVGLTSRWRGTVIESVGNEVFAIWNGTGSIPNLEESAVGENGWVVGEIFAVSATGFNSVVDDIENIENDGLYEFKEQITNLNGSIAEVEEINLTIGQNTPIARLRYGIGVSTTTFEVVDPRAASATPVSVGTFVVGDKYQIGSEILQIISIEQLSASTRLTASRAQLGTAAVSHETEKPIYSTEIEVNDKLVISKTTGTYQSKPGLFNIQLNDIIVGSKSKVISLITLTDNYKDPYYQGVPQGFSDLVAGTGYNDNTITQVATRIRNAQNQITAYRYVPTTGGTGDGLRVTIQVSASGGITSVNFSDDYRGLGYTAGDVITIQGGNNNATFVIQSVNNPIIDQVTISSSASFFGLLFNRITSIQYPNTIIDDIASSQVQIVNYDDNTVSFDANFPSGELITNYILEYDNETGVFEDDEDIRNYEFEYGNSSGTFSANENVEIRQLAISDKDGPGFFSAGQILRSESMKAEVLGYNYGRGIVYLGKTGRGTATGLSNYTINFIGNARLLIDQKKFGASSLYVDGDGDYLQIPTNSFQFGTNDFTIEFWARPSILTGTQVIFDMRTSSNDTAVYLEINASGNVRFFTAGSYRITSSVAVTVSTWNHIALSRSSGVTRLFVNGTLTPTTYTDSNNYGARPLVLGRNFSGSASYQGYIDELRISNSSRYASTFVPPTGIYQGDANTSLLFHFDGANNATTVEDWGGAPSYVEGEEFVNTGVAFRYYDAANAVLNNIDLIAEEAVYRTDREYPRLHIPTTVASNRGADSYNLLLSNLNFIAWEAYQRVAPTPPVGTTAQDCVDDVKDVIRNIAYNLKYGYNSKTWDAAEQYISAGVIQHITGKVTESVNVFNQAKAIAKQVINNYTVTKQGAHAYVQTKDETISIAPGGCTDIENQIESLMDIITDTIQDPDGNDPTGYPASITATPRTHPPHSRCITDVKLVLEALCNDLRTGGNHNMWDAAAFYVDRSISPVALNHVVGEEAETAYAYETASTIAIQAMRNQSITIEGDHGYTQVIDATVTPDPDNPDCANVASTIDTLMSIVADTITAAYVSPAELIIDPNALPADHLATITRVQPSVQWASGKISTYLTNSLTVTDTASTVGRTSFFTNEIADSSRNRFYDAANLIRANSEVIVDEAAGRLIARYPDLASDMPRNTDGSTRGTERCKTDLGLILNAIAKDVQYGGNYYSTLAAKAYLGENDEVIHIRLQLVQSLYAHTQLGELCKNAIDGTLVAQYTDTVIVPPIGITVDAGGCQNVKTAIDTIIDNINEILAPTGQKYRDGADLIIKNKNYIAEEAIGLLEDEFFYELGSNTYQAFTYPTGDNLKCIRDAKLLIDSFVSDLLTGGNVSTVKAAKFYISPLNVVTSVEDQLLATTYAVDRIKFLGKKALRNLLQSLSTISLSSQHYVAQHTQKTAYVDNTIIHDVSTPGGIYNENDCVDVAAAWDNICETFISVFTDSATGSSSGRMILFNKNYYEREISAGVNAQWGTNAWQEAAFLDTLVNDVIYDVATTTDAWYVSGQTSGISNIQAYNTARSLISPISSLTSGLNLIPFAQVEAITGSWSIHNGSVTQNASTAPDGTTTADKYIPNTSTGTDPNLYTDSKAISRSYTLTSYTTYDRETLTWDNETSGNTLDQGVDVSTQRYTWSMFFKDSGYSKARIRFEWDSSHYVFFNIDLSTGTIGSIFKQNMDSSYVSAGIYPHGNGWYRAYITVDVPFGITSARLISYGMNNSSNPIAAGDGVNGVLMWGAKFAKGDIDIYTSQAGTLFYPNNELNIRKYIISELRRLIKDALDQDLVSPSPRTSFLPYTNSSLLSIYSSNINDVMTVVNNDLDIIDGQLLSNTYFTSIESNTTLTTPTITYGTRDPVIPIGGEITQANYVYGTASDKYCEIQQIYLNEAKIAKSYVRLVISNVTNGPFVVNDTTAKQGDPSVTGVIYGLYADENFTYMDMQITAGPWAVGNVLVSSEGASATIVSIQPRLHLIDLIGEFKEGIPFKGYANNYTADATDFFRNEAAVTSNVGGKLTVDTASLTGTFETTSVVYPENSRQYIDITQYSGLELRTGETIISGGHQRFLIAIQNDLDIFDEGGIIYGVSGGVKDTNKRAIITEIDLNNNYLYVKTIAGTWSNGDLFGYYGNIDTGFPVGYAQVIAIVNIAGSATATIVDIKQVGLLTRVFIRDVQGTFSNRDVILARNSYGAAIRNIVDLKARVKRSFRGFDGSQSTFKLTTDNGTAYFPDPEGHLLVFVNGILQPPGADGAYTAFSDNIAFSEAPDLGASFVAFYLGKLRQLDDISSEFDSLRQSFNLKRNGVFYSLTLTDGVRSNVVRPENNIVISLNGIVQEPGVAFTLVGSRVIFSEIPRAGSTFVAFSYVGSEADVDAAEVIPPIEAGDVISIQSETLDREVAVIESSNSLITFEYLGSVFGRGGEATANITKGRISEVRVTNGGSNYTTRPTVRIDSTSGFDAQIKALVGVQRVEMVAQGTGYKSPIVLVENTVDDNYQSPDIDNYPLDGTGIIRTLDDTIPTDAPGFTTGSVEIGPDSVIESPTTSYVLTNFVVTSIWAD